MKFSGMLALFLLVSCGQEEGRPPVARITATPDAIPEHDNFSTDVTLDGSGSSDPIDDPDSLDPLELQWEIAGDEYDLQPGSDLEDTVPVLRFRGDTPATIRLTVTDVDGRSSTAELQMRLSIP